MKRQRWRRRAQRGQESRTNGKRKILDQSVKCDNAEPVEGNKIGCDHTAAAKNSLAETASSGQESKVVLQELRIEVDTLRADNSDDNKENLSNAEQLIEEDLNNLHPDGENMQLENNENVPLKVAKMQNKLNPEHGGKLKTTNPKPFRLRTDERRVLKDANPERKQPFAENNSMAVLKDANRGVMCSLWANVLVQRDETSRSVATNRKKNPNWHWSAW